jgi:hypothetical protein
MIDRCRRRDAEGELVEDALDRGEERRSIARRLRLSFFAIAGRIVLSI